MHLQRFSLKLNLRMPEINQWLTQSAALFHRNRDRLWSWTFIVVISFFLAKTANLLISHYWLPLELPGDNSASSQTTLNVESKTDLRRILSRNLFNSSAKIGPIIPIEPEPVNEQEIRPSSINAELMGTVVFQNSKYSVALIKDRSVNSSQYFGIGDSILGAKLFRIERFRVILQRDGRLESLELQAAKSKIDQSVSPTRPIGPSPKSGDVGLEELGPNRFLIPQDTVDGLMNNLPQILRDARAVPNIGKTNQIDGFKLIEIKQGSIYDKLGLKNGDIVKRINEDDLNSVEKGMSLFNALRNEKSISIDIERGGSRLNYTYEIR
ncbi:MAG: hypothetical protein COV44_06025 [Deltaproteobacteria bacterium CG11_big_fil_rev_8_21_14_0_20_45_16]|nr:MAG: hypothetical protein COV44_06025 [Deltaproteobacteria bacterium CG11_big_fil_rev_8_21_14_0_20_45_16]